MATTSIDLKLKDGKNGMEIPQALAADDAMEIGLRRLAVHCYEQRGGDRAGAMHMPGAAPPGGSADAAPTRRVASATTHSKTKHQRRERAEAELRSCRKKEGDGKGGGRDGRGGGRGRRKAATPGGPQ